MARTPIGPDGPTVARLLRSALLEIRALGREGDALQAADLADAVHNLPTAYSEGRLDTTRLRGSLHAYARKYGGKTRFDFATILDSAEPEMEARQTGDGELPA